MPAGAKTLHANRASHGLFGVSNGRGTRDLTPRQRRSDGILPCQRPCHASPPSHERRCLRASQSGLARVFLSAARPHFGPILHQPDCQCQQGTSLNLGITKAKVSSAAWHSAASSATSRERKRGRRAADWWWTLACKPTSWILARCVFKLLRSPKRRAHATKTTLRAYLQMTCSARRSCQKYLLWRLASIMCRRASKPPYLVIRGFRLPWQPWHWISRPIERFKAAST